MRKLLSFAFTALCLFWYLAPTGCSKSSDNQQPPPNSQQTPGNTHALSLTVVGAGEGTVTSSSGGISCKKSGGACNANLNPGTSVTLTAQEDPGYVFHGWMGGNCKPAATCVVTMDAAKNIKAAFVPVVYHSNRALDTSNATIGNDNIWITKTDGTGAKALTNLNMAGASSMTAQWSPDGTKVAYASSQDKDGNPAANAPHNTSNIWVMNADGSDAKALTKLAASNAGSTFPQWSPDGTKIAFVSSRNPDLTDSAINPVTSVSNIWVMNADGSDPKALTKLSVANAGSNYPQWSPDGSKIVYSSSRATDLSMAPNTNNVNNIWVMGADGSDPKALTNFSSASAHHFNPQWSPDGTKITFASARDKSGGSGTNTNNIFNIWVMNADGTDPKALTKYTANQANNYSPQWSLDGTKIVYSSGGKPDGTDFGNNWVMNIWTVPSDGLTPPTHLTDLTIFDSSSVSPQWSVDGKKIVYSSCRALDKSNAANGVHPASVFDIWIMNADGTDPLAITPLTNAGGIAHSSNPQL